MPDTDATEPARDPRPRHRRGGRRRDPARDTAILDAALDVLAEEGFDRMTVGVVATRAKAGKATVYRRWPTKVDLVLDAVAHGQRAEAGLDRLPDTGTLRGDLVALARPTHLDEERRRLRVLTAVMSVSARAPRLAAAADAAGTGTWVEANRTLIQRAVDRGEHPAVDVRTLARLIPTLCASRVCLQQRSVTRGFVETLVDAVLIPALRGSTKPISSGTCESRNLGVPSPGTQREVVTMPSQRPTEPTPIPDADEPVRPGRKRDHSRDAVILDAALDVLAEAGWEGMTMDLVAQRAKAGKATLYRRWPSKTDLVLDAITHLNGDGSAVVALPDTGSLTGDLLALLQPDPAGERHMKVGAALTAMTLHHRELAGQIDAALQEPWVQANRAAIERAISRGEFSAGVDVDTLSRVIPAMTAYRMLLQHRDLDEEHLRTLIDSVLIPALRGAPPAP